jgi:hypothetical protein
VPTEERFFGILKALDKRGIEPAYHAEQLTGLPTQFKAMVKDSEYMYRKRLEGACARRARSWQRLCLQKTHGHNGCPPCARPARGVHTAARISYP